MGWGTGNIGGGAGLNLKVVGGTVQPANPAENTVWVSTDTAITDWIFSAIQPTSKSDGTPLSDGEVWFDIGVSSPAQFNALKKNGLYVYPTACQQYVGGSWVRKEAKTYKSGSWVDWRTYLFKNGEGAVSPFEVVPLRRPAATEGNYVSYDNNTINFNASALAYGDLGVTFKPAINGKKTLYVTYTSIGGCGFGVGSTLYSNADNIGQAMNLASVGVPASSTKSTISLDISNVAGDMYVVFTVSATTTGVITKIYDVWFE